MGSDKKQIAFLGFGEAAQAFAQGLSAEALAPDMCAFDIKTDGPGAAAKQADYHAHGVFGCDTNSAACVDRAAIFSLVTADQADRAAQSASLAPLDGAFFFDCNSCAPNTKIQSAKRIEAAGGRYVDVAVMTPVHPKLHQAPCLLAGPHAVAAKDLMQSFGMSVEIAGASVGAASTRKMIRSVMIKGLEALTLECFLAARAAGVETETLASLDASFAVFDWAKRAPYMMERAATHGNRRAEEMREVAKTLKDLGLAPLMTKGTVARQDEVGALGLAVADLPSQDLQTLADAILNGLAKPQDQDSRSED